MDGYVNHFSKSTRILAHTKIDKIPFKFESGQHFTLYARPLDDGDDHIDVIIECKLHQDKESSEFPIPLFNWTPAMITEVTYADLSNYEFYVGLQNELEVNDEEEKGKLP
jgi:hypothetical protein